MGMSACMCVCICTRVCKRVWLRVDDGHVYAYVYVCLSPYRGQYIFAWESLIPPTSIKRICQIKGDQRFKIFVTTPFRILAACCLPIF